MKKIKKKGPATEGYDTITEADPFGLGITLTVVRNGHKSMQKAGKRLGVAHAALQREETLLLKRFRDDEENAILMREANAEHAERHLKLKAASDRLGQAFQADTRTQSQRDHETLYALCPEYLKAFDALQDEHAPILTRADQLDTVRRVRKWEGDAFDETEKWTGTEDLERARAILFDDLGELGEVPAFLTADGEELEEGSKLETKALKLSDAYADRIAECQNARSGLIAELMNDPEPIPAAANDADADTSPPTPDNYDEWQRYQKALVNGTDYVPADADTAVDTYNYHVPVRLALEAFGHDPTTRPFGHFKRRCLEGVPPRYAPYVTDTALHVYQECERFNREEEKAAADYEKALRRAGLASTGSFSRMDPRSGKIFQEPFHGYAYPLAVSLWISDLSNRAQAAFEKKSRRGRS